MQHVRALCLVAFARHFPPMLLPIIITHVLVMTPITPPTSAVSCEGGESPSEEEDDEEDRDEKDEAKLPPMPVKGKPQSKFPPPTVPPPQALLPAAAGARAFPPPSVVARLQCWQLLAAEDVPSIRGPPLEPPHAGSERRW